MLLVISPPVIIAVRESLAGRAPKLRHCFHEGYRHLGPLVQGLMIALVVLAPLVILVIGLPVAIWLVVLSQFFGQAVLLEDMASGRMEIHRSAAVVRGHWWRTLFGSLMFQLFVLVAGLLDVGFQ